MTIVDSPDKITRIENDSSELTPGRTQLLVGMDKQLRFEGDVMLGVSKWIGSEVFAFAQAAEWQAAARRSWTIAARDEEEEEDDEDDDDDDDDAEDDLEDDDFEDDLEDDLEEDLEDEDFDDEDFDDDLDDDDEDDDDDEEEEEEDDEV